MDRESLHAADLISVAIREQAVELAAVALEFRTLVEHLAEGVLDRDDLLADADLAAEFLLDVGRSREMVRMDVRLDQPLHVEPLAAHEIDDLVGGFIGNAAGRIVEIHDGIDDGASLRAGIAHDVADRVGSRVEKGCHLRLDAEIDTVGEFRHALPPAARWPV